MKKVLLLTLAVCFLLPISAQAKKRESKRNEQKELKVMSYNIRLGIGKDGTNSWEYRCPATIELLNDQKPDVFGIQEAMEFQVRFIDEYCPDYKNVGVGRDDGKKKGEFMSIFWNKKTVSMIKWGTFWLSETPDKPTKGWDAGCFRTATWAIMKDKKTGKKFCFINTHLDHKGAEARRKGLELILEWMKDINPKGYPVVLTGDFNVKPDDKALVGLDKVMQCTRKIASKTDNINTLNGWSIKPTDKVIDFIYISGFSACPEYQTVTKKYADRPFVSDHYPIISRLVF